ncbi:MAG TPA: hypothetical protein VIQ27_15265 [Gemmatimonadales bacterium]
MLQIDPILSLAFAMHETKGGYALLIGSGISRAASIPTGWEVVLDLINRVAVLDSAAAPADPVAWYREKYGGEPDYSVLLEALAGTPAERRQMLRKYFEPTDEDRTTGVKVPTAAHRAIAELARRGYIRVVLTTNFDRLQEQAMEAAGLTPVVISVADAIDGTMPLIHAPLTVIKLHGDYLDSRLKNTEAELGAYDPKLDLLLDRILDEFGLVVCGWSASWDAALRRAIAMPDTPILDVVGGEGGAQSRGERAGRSAASSRGADRVSRQLLPAAERSDHCARGDCPAAPGQPCPRRFDGQAIPSGSEPADPPA